MSEIDRAALIGALPYARRFARALTGSQSRGDGLVAQALRGSLAPVEGGRDAGMVGRLALYRAICQIASKGASDLPDHDEAPGAAMDRTQRMLLLLTSLEELETEQAALALGLPPDQAAQYLAAARNHLRAGAVARVLIIEDEPIIALDLQQLVEAAGHEVVGIAGSEDEAVAIAAAERPSLVLADVNLGAGGDGTSAVARIMRTHQAPVIFVTAYPERLLTGQDLEPAFIITKPFEPTTLAIATYQAVTRGVHLDPV
ncbi:PhyR family response regulator anti-anti-sigma factor [Falsiroseomonas tokyonensis]|uniref:PhyR family response regulator anti-anti-sigma factor n=1 Tax=Falsiroseomonas tokyonensis TaxID=430521 RepID=A0ABV7BWP9_9PROT|nr:response regulator [Falsiroseomonas tokyonensis]MBU8538834.1 response regulator [Falsiroseomonas tokyonensis]